MYSWLSSYKFALKVRERKDFESNDSLSKVTFHMSIYLCIDGKYTLANPNSGVPIPKFSVPICEFVRNSEVIHFP